MCAGVRVCEVVGVVCDVKFIKQLKLCICAENTLEDSKVYNKSWIIFTIISLMFLNDMFPFQNA